MKEFIHYIDNYTADWGTRQGINFKEEKLGGTGALHLALLVAKESRRFASPRCLVVLPRKPLFLLF